MMLPIAMLLLMQATPAPTAIAPTDSGDPPDRVARLAVLEGSVFFQPSGDTSTDSWSDASINYPLTSGDRVYADQGGRAELQLGDCTLRINGVADLTLATLTDDFLQLSLAQGTLEVSVYDLSGGDSIEVDTPNGALLLRQDGVYRIDVSESDNASTTIVSVDRGLADVFAGDAVQALRGGSALRLEGYDVIRVSSASRPTPDDFDRWCADRDQALGSSASAQYVGRDVPGYSDLDHHGRWETEADYGPVWYPTTVVVGWAPYRYGRWVWIDPWGWTWLDDAPWGFVPSHYGRWVWLRSRWGWVPGRWPHRPCYAPALVVFVSTGRVGVQAWFPLGPGEPYHPWYHHGPRYRQLVNPGITVVATRQVRYVNRPRTIVVPISVVQRGDPVGRRAVPATGAEATRAQPIAHPRVSPLPRAASGGRPAARPPAVRRPTVDVQPWRRPSVARPATPTQRPPRRVIARTPPARQALPFPTRQRAMQPEPGWPLEPQQRRNLREGKPAGPHRDIQEPPRRTTTPRARQPAKKPPPKKP